VDPSKSLRLSEHKDLEKKVRQAQNQHVTVEVIDGEINEQLRAELEEGMRAWQEGRTGSQIHTTQLRPFSDREHRTYIVARNEGKKVRSCFRE
jgi:ergosteryl-3beta-O-L-aspartate synthase